MLPPDAKLPPAVPGLRIVRASPDDADTLSELIHELARFEQLEHECAMTPALAMQHLLGPARSAEALIAWLDEAPVGFAVYYRTFSTFVARPGLYLEDLYVRERFRHRGIGRNLLFATGRLALHQKAGRLEWTALKWNENARRLYASIGAREMEEWLMLRMDTAALGGLACADHGKGPGAGCGCGGNRPGHVAGGGPCGC